MHKYILGIDPSGAFKQGKGRSGIVLFNSVTNRFVEVSEIDAGHFTRVHDYWDAHIEAIANVIDKYSNPAVEKHNIAVVIEDYLLYADKASSQINSRFETSQLIGVIKHACWNLNVYYRMQQSSLVMQRWSDKVLLQKGYIALNKKSYVEVTTQKRTSVHQRDAIRHALHYAYFGNKEGSKKDAYVN